MSEENNLEDHRKMLMISGSLSDFQITNMKTWPYIFFNNIEKVELNYDFSEFNLGGSSPKPGHVVYNITINKSLDLEKNNNMLDKSKETLINATKMLFWKETEVVVNVVV